MNSIIQCLSNTRPLLEFCISKQYNEEINKESKMKGSLISGMFFLNWLVRSHINVLLLGNHFISTWLPQLIVKYTLMEICTAYSDVISPMWSRTGEVVSPSEFKYRMEKYAPRFAGYGCVFALSFPFAPSACDHC